MASERGRGRQEAHQHQVNGMGWPEWADRLAVERLREPLRSGRVGHAYLISGPRGVGKSDLARAFSQAICCTNSSSSDRSQPCGECRACRNASRGSHPDVEWFDLEVQSRLAEKATRGTSLSIDSMRRLRASASLLPLEAPRRILIVDDAETLLEPAQQALLKTLEEPPPTVTFLLLADEEEALLETVRSRCQAMPVRLVSRSVIEGTLLGRGIESALASEIALLSRGCPAWAVTASGNGTVLDARRKEFAAASDWIRSSPYERLVTAFQLGEQFSKRRSHVFGVVQASTQVLREEMIRRLNAEGDVDELRATGDQGTTAPLTLARAISASLQCLVDLDSNVRPRLALEAMVLAWPSLDLQPY